jgi:hypothetical protein
MVAFGERIPVNEAASHLKRFPHSLFEKGDSEGDATTSTANKVAAQAIETRGRIMVTT